MNIINNLMAGVEFIDEVKGNMIKFYEHIADFKDLHASYAEALEEEIYHDFDEKWNQPRCAQITAFIAKATSWIRAIEDPSSPILAEATSSAAHVEDPLPDSADNTEQDLDLIDAQSGTSKDWTETSTSSRINTEAERVALLAKASKFQEKHVIEEQEKKY